MKRRIKSSLLAKGYLPKELPPVFTSTDFGTHSQEIMASWSTSGVYKTKQVAKVSKGKVRQGSYLYDVRDTEAEIISKPKRSHERRDIHVVHPIPQLLLSYEIGENWRSLSKIIARSCFSDDNIVVSDRYERAVKSIDFDLHRKKKKYIESSSNWLLETDVTRFYHSIYTHSLPWAAYGKEKVKSGLKTYAGSLGDRLDALLRACNRNQTIGIPVGPETSRIIAEIISGYVDFEVSDSLMALRGTVIDRLQDDWIVGVQTLEAAELALTELRAAYGSLGLEMNGAKTHITRLVDRPSDDWVAEIRGNLLHRKDHLTGANLADFLSMCLMVQQKYPSSSAISYALTITESLDVADYDVKALEAFLLRCAVVAPGAMDRVCSAMLNLENRSKAVSKSKVCHRLYEIALASAKQGFMYEAIWALYTIRGLKYRIDARELIAVEAVRASSIMALILLDMKERGSLVGSLPITLWSSCSADEIRSGPRWLLSYEGIRNGWLPDPGNLASTAFFDPMMSRNVVFYDKRRNMPTASAKAKRRRAGKRRSRTAPQSTALGRMHFLTLHDLLTTLDATNEEY